MSMYDPVVYSRLLTGLTLSFHIIFATIGVGIPVLIALAEWAGLRRNDPHYLLLARRWSRGFVVTVAVGVVTGTAIGLQLNLLWPKFMQVAGQTFALPLFMETFAFFFEAIFLGIYLYTWDRFADRRLHLLLLLPFVIGSSGSAFLITVFDSFMNTPQGFELADGVATNIRPLEAMFNPATPTKVSHVLVSAYLTSALILAAIPAWSMLRGRITEYNRKALRFCLAAALVFAGATALVGDLSGKFLAKYQPEKLAAAEWHFETIRKAPLVLGGILDETGDVKYGLEIPYALSILAGGSPNAPVIGLNEFPADERPPLVVHYLFDAMVVIGLYAFAVPLAYVLLRRFRPEAAHNRWLLGAVLLAAPLAMLAIEFGWLYAEVGRQPWILRGYMKTADGATDSAHVDTMLWVFAGLYVVLSWTMIRVLRRMFRNSPPEAELQARFGR